MTPEAADARLAAQPDLEPKLALADIVIENDGSLAALQTQVDAAWTRALAADTREQP
jgi:dephospho-CoA kinase